MSAVNIRSIQILLNSLTRCNSKGQCQLSIYRCIQVLLDSLTSCNSKGDRVSGQYNIDVFRYGWIHLQPAIVKEHSVSYYRYIHMRLFLQMYIDSLFLLL